MDRLIKFVLLVISILILIYFPWNRSLAYDNSNVIKNINKEPDIFEKFENPTFNYNKTNTPIINNNNFEVKKNLDNTNPLQKNIEQNLKYEKPKQYLTNKILNNDENALYSNFDKDSITNINGESSIDSVFNTNIIKKSKKSKTPKDVVDTNKNNKKYNAKDFLPKEINDEWFDTDFSQAKHDINDNKLINTDKYIIGVNTVGQSLKNASYDIRGTVANPKIAVSPWNNSTYEPDYNIKPLC